MTFGATRKAAAAHADLFGHPKGLSVLFATEMWERFSYFGMSALLVLYMVKYLLLPGQIESVIGYGPVKGALEFLFGRLEPQPFASQLFGFYTGLAYLTPILGGLLADRVLGQRRTVMLGGVLMAIGHFLMAVESLFLIALLLLILCIGAFKPNISTQVGELYATDDPRRTRAYSVFYVGINIGAFLAPIVCGTLAVAYGWHWGFAAAGLGMLVSLAIYLSCARHLPPDEMTRGEGGAREHAPLDRGERQRVMALLIICALVAFFWATYDQQNNTLVLWTEDSTDRSVSLLGWRGEIPTTWFLALNPLMIFLFTPLLMRRWAQQAARSTEPRATSKMAFGCLCIALGNLIMVAAAFFADGGKASALWLLAYFAVVTIGELHLAPVGLALVSKVAPAKVLSMMMGVWFATTFPGDILAGWLGGFWSSMGKPQFFLMIASIAALAGVAIWAASPALNSMFEKHEQTTGRVSAP
jgi:POT family proton-dependent oligopeptide transporter